MFFSIFNPVKLLFLQITIKKHLKNMQENILTKNSKKCQKNIEIFYFLILLTYRLLDLNPWPLDWESDTLPLYHEVLLIYILKFVTFIKIYILRNMKQSSFNRKNVMLHLKNSQVTVCEAVIIWNASVLTFWLTYFYRIFYKFRKNTNIETCHILDIFMSHFHTNLASNM